jgi:hypothetical protein
MKDLSIPIPALSEGEQAEVHVTIGGKKIEYHFRVEAFPWDRIDGLHEKHADELEKSLARITRLKNAINSYDKEWELIQIFNPSENAKFIQVLYRKKQ